MIRSISIIAIVVTLTAEIKTLVRQMLSRPPSYSNIRAIPQYLFPYHLLLIYVLKELAEPHFLFISHCYSSVRILSQLLVTGYKVLKGQYYKLLAFLSKLFVSLL